MEKIKELKEIIDGIISFIELLEEILDDGKITNKDIFAILKVVPDLQKAVKGSEKVMEEIKTITEADLDVIKAYVKDNLDLENDELESKVEEIVEYIFVFIKGIIASK